MSSRPDTDHRALWTPRQLAEFLGPPISVKTIYDWNYRGVGPRYCRIGRHVRFRPADVQAWLKQHEVDNAQALSEALAASARQPSRKARQPDSRDTRRRRSR